MADKLSTTQSSSGLDLKFDIFERHTSKNTKSRIAHIFMRMESSVMTVTAASLIA